MMRRFASSKVPVVGLVAAAALVAPAAASTPATLAATTTPPRCVSSQLVVWMGIPGDGAAGSVYYPIEFTNVGAKACTLYGFPGMSAWANGHRVGSPASWVHTVASRTVTVRPGGTAHTVLRVVNVANYPSSTCRPATATSIKVFPPSTTAAHYIPFRLRACSVVGTDYLSVWGPIVAGVGVPGH